MTQNIINYKNILIEACKNSAIILENDMPSIKLNLNTGSIFFIAKGRHLDIIEYSIDNFGEDIWDLINSDDNDLLFCEANPPFYTVSLKQNL